MSLPPRPPRIATLAPGIRRIIAENPSFMTYWGTNTYVIGTGRVAVIDPGPSDGDQIETLLEMLAPSEEISHILVTHAHLDHSPGARALSVRTGAPVLAYGGPEAGRSALMRDLAAAGQISGGEGVDHAFAPDLCLADGETVQGETWRVQALWTPGHFGNHLSFACPEQQALFCGDLVMGWSSSLISPPDGDLSAFMASLDRLAGRTEAVYYPGHGDPIPDPAGRLADLAAHRRMRTDQIRRALDGIPADAPTLAARIYTDIPAASQPAAARNVLAHLIDMASRNEVRYAPPLTAASVFSLAPK